MTTFSCIECRFRFEAAAASSCPRCGSASIEEFKPRGVVGPHVIRDGKDGWVDFHSQQSKLCPHCGGAEFDLNYKRKEKVCRKCGEVLPLPRRMA